MQEIIEALLGTLLAPVNFTCDVISDIVSHTDLGVARRYDHEWTKKCFRLLNSCEHLRNYAGYMIYQANILDTLIKADFNGIILYASPCKNEETEAAIEKICEEYHRELERRSQIRNVQQMIVRWIFPPMEIPTYTSDRAVRQLERFLHMPTSGWGYP